MNLFFLGMTLDIIGKALLALGIIWVHVKMTKERRIDDVVIRSFHTEICITIVGFAFMLTGYILEVMAFGGFNNFIGCVGEACTHLPASMSTWPRP